MVQLRIHNVIGELSISILWIFWTVYVANRHFADELTGPDSLVTIILLIVVGGVSAILLWMLIESVKMLT